ncbi:hypothetical protein Ab1vBOLIVR2_gp15 [Agrobacterium phage OLIVR2]|uniref:Uncharacterized protein n=1 Tax=Agrobacterium phage OLIVR1 TaxID=2723769 RepID=A0A858MU04_9CAUD|nr:hypothetical protein [Xanthomonas campestris]YP_010107049.1 hypothetical protein KNU98_gp094 [Agrobacterium phage OLIVR1]QIW87318.1 hypothetical protein Ab1vBOLIVR2_gp15 [Agrobacterium phage OLIVR2]QIW87425.1 hypothetical protein Ab1vBOLIVR3_gp15 [Agrobacterium phage OLIVR3]MCF8861614.1 hypothetical protein [Xanthomonas campestris pv. campestris]QIW87210.1 hypothetical protein Ab1vBOLIVR1_gp15 [Agrobacterium phage OLIVR1]
MSNELTLTEHRQEYIHAKRFYEEANVNKLTPHVAKHEARLMEYHALSIVHWEWRNTPLPISKADFLSLKSLQDKAGL